MKYQLSDEKTLKEVLYIPNFKYELLFVSKLIKQLSFYVNFFLYFCVLHDLSSGKVMGIDEQNGLYLVQDDNVKSCNLVSTFVTSKEKDLPFLWHQRLGHIYLSKMKQLKPINNCISKSCKSLDCDISPLAKQTRFPFLASQIKFVKSLWLSSCYIWNFGVPIIMRL